MRRYTPPPPPPEPPSETAPDAKVIAFPSSGPASLAQRQAEVARQTAEVQAFSQLAMKEMLLRMKYEAVLRTLSTIETMQPVPDDWRARLNDPEARAAALRDDDAYEDEEDEEDLED